LRWCAGSNEQPKTIHVKTALRDINRVALPILLLGLAACGGGAQALAPAASSLSTSPTSSITTPAPSASTPGGATSTAPASLAHQVIQPQENGVYIGAGALGNIASLESSVGRVLQIDLWNNFAFFNLQHAFNSGSLADDGPRGRISVIAFNCSGEDAGSIASGAFDSTLVADAKAAAAYGYPFMMRIAKEMNLYGNTPTECFTRGESLGQQQSEYIAMYQHVVNVFLANGATKVTFLWCPAVGPEHRENTAAITGGFYPGAAYVDWVCADAYDKPSPGGGFNYTWGHSNPAIDPTAFLAQYGKPVILAETGECTAGAGENCTGYKQIQGTFLSGLASALERGGILNPLVKAVAYSDYNDPTTGYDYTLDASGLPEYAKIATNSFFNPMDCTATSCPAPPTTRQY
jgi:hypothetical protein